MLISEILEMLNQREGAKLEFKDDFTAEDLAKEIVSFANMNGGHIVLGVEDETKIIIGVQREKLQAWVMDTVIGRYVHPHILPDYEEVVVEGKKVVVLTIPMGVAKPYTLRSKDREDIYVRYGDTCQLASREQQARLFASGGLVSAEKFPVYGSVADELDAQRYQEYFVEILKEEERSNWHEFLVNRSFLIGEGNALYCSYFAYALFGKNPQGKLPQSGVRVTVYPGSDKDYQTLLDEHLNSALVELRGHYTDNNPVEKALHDKVVDILKPFISREYMKGSTRQRHWDYPLEALRELLVNAFIHRDWTKQNYVRVVVYSNRLEVISPGAFPNGITIEKIKYGEQSQRNPTCIRIFRDYGYLEDQGMGIRRKVIPSMLKHTGREPEFETGEDEDHVKVTLWKGS